MSIIIAQPSSSATKDCEGPSSPKRGCRTRTGDNVPSCRPLPLPINIWQLASLIDTEEKAIVFSQHAGLLPLYSWCPTCFERIENYKRKCERGRLPSYRFRCCKGDCRKARTANEVNLKKGTWFEGSHLSIRKSLVLAYCFARNFSLEQTIVQSSLENHTSSETVADYFNNCREVCAETVCFSGSEATRIGGPNHTVEIEIDRLNKRKLNRDQRGDGQWVLCGICRETEECFLVPLEAKTDETLIALIKEHVSIGSIICSDCFRSNDILQAEGYGHLPENHCKKIVDHNTDDSANLFESLSWSDVRRSMPCYKSLNKVGAYLAEYIWRRTNRDGDLFLALLRDMGKVFPGPQIQ